FRQLIPWVGNALPAEPPTQRRRRRKERAQYRGMQMSKVAVPALAAVALLVAVPALSQTSAPLPDGPGKEAAAAYCNSCHTLLSRVGAGYTRQGWDTVLRMMKNHGISVPQDEVASLTEYLVKTFPEQAKPEGRDRAGPAQITIKTWTVPTPGSRPHDPLGA